MKVVEVYFSGTGNTEWVATELAQKLGDRGNEVVCMSIEDISVERLSEMVQECQLLVVLYPAYGNDIPEVLEMYLKKLNEKISNCTTVKALSIDVPALYSADGSMAVEWFFNVLRRSLLSSLGGR